MLKVNPGEKRSYGANLVPIQTRISQSNSASVSGIPVTYSRYWVVFKKRGKSVTLGGQNSKSESGNDDLFSSPEPKAHLVSL